MSSFLPIFMGMKWFVVYVFVVCFLLPDHFEYGLYFIISLSRVSLYVCLLLPLDLGKQGLCSRSSGSSVL